MALLELSEFFKKAQSLQHSAETGRVYLIGGDEIYLKREIYSLLKNKFFPQNFEFNYSHFELEKSDVEAIEMEIKSYPMMADFRLVTIEISQSTPEPKVKSLAHTFESLDFFDTYVVVQFEKSDFKKTYLNKLISKFMAVECKIPYSYQIPTWIQQIAQRYNLKFRDEALAVFHERVGDNLSYIDLEIQKLQGFAQSGWVTEQMISTLVVRSSEANVFEAIRYFFLRDAIKAIQAFETLLNSGESPILIVSLIARQARLLLKLYCGYQSNLQGPKLAQYLKIPPYFLKQYEAEASKWDVSSLNHLLSDLSELDLRLKTKSQDVSEVILNWTLAHTF